MATLQPIRKRPHKITSMPTLDPYNSLISPKQPMVQKRLQIILPINEYIRKEERKRKQSINSDNIYRSQTNRRE